MFDQTMGFSPLAPEGARPVFEGEDKNAGDDQNQGLESFRFTDLDRSGRPGGPAPTNSGGPDPGFDTADDGQGDPGQCIEKARQKAGEIEAEAYEKGFAQGEKDGLELGRKKVDPICERLEALVDDLTGWRPRFVADNEDHIIQAVARAAEKVALATADLEPEPVRRAVLEAVSLCIDSREITIRANPRDLSYIEEMRPELFARLDSLASVSMVGDPEITKGGVLVQTDFGDVDGRLESRFERIRQVLTGEVSSDRNGDLNGLEPGVSDH